jgi:hypothetical protein
MLVVYVENSLGESCDAPAEEQFHAMVRERKGALIQLFAHASTCFRVRGCLLFGPRKSERLFTML